MRNLICIILALCWAMLPGITEAVDLAALETSNRLLRAEYELATKSKVYFVFDLPEKKVHFKASGLVVAELPLKSVTYWGPFGTDKVRSLAAKHSFNAPEREVLKIPSPEETSKTEPEKKAETKEEPKKFELAALELSDMPTSYQLRFDDDLLVSVKPAPESFFGRIWQGLGKGFWYLSRPLITVWKFLHKETYSEILLTMPPKDAQMLYWSLADGSSCILLN